MVTTTATDEQGRPAEPGAINGGLLHRQVEYTASDAEIADELNLSEATVKTHSTRIFAKLDATNRAARGCG